MRDNTGFNRIEFFADTIDVVDSSIRISQQRFRVFDNRNKSFTRLVHISHPYGCPGMTQRFFGNFWMDKSISIDKTDLCHRHRSFGGQNTTVVEIFTFGFLSIVKMRDAIKITGNDNRDIIFISEIFLEIWMFE